MKILFMTLTVLFLSACSPDPMNPAVSDAIGKCLEKGWVPKYFSNGGNTTFTCLPGGKDKPGLSIN